MAVLFIRVLEFYDRTIQMTIQILGESVCKLTPKLCVSCPLFCFPLTTPATIILGSTLLFLFLSSSPFFTSTPIGCVLSQASLVRHCSERDALSNSIPLCSLHFKLLQLRSDALARAKTRTRPGARQSDPLSFNISTASSHSPAALSPPAPQEPRPWMRVTCP